MSSALSALSVVLVAVSAQGADRPPVVKLASSPVAKQVQYESVEAGPASALPAGPPQASAMPLPATGPGAPMAHHGHAGPVPSYGGGSYAGGACGGGSCGGGACGGGCGGGTCGPAPGCDCCFNYFGYWGLPNHHCPPGNLHQHIPYIAYPKSYYYFRPYNYFHIPDQQQEVLSYGGDARDPYTNRVFNRVYDRMIDPSMGPGPGFVPTRGNR